MTFQASLRSLMVLTALVGAGQVQASSLSDTNGASTSVPGHHIGASARKMIRPAPEPETWAMMGVGLTMLGALARRRLAKR